MLGQDAPRAGQNVPAVTAPPSKDVSGTAPSLPVLEVDPEPDMSSQQAIAHLASLLEDLAADYDSKQQLKEALSLRLLAMQLLLLALGYATSNTSSKHAPAPPVAVHSTAPQVQEHAVVQHSNSDDQSQPAQQHQAESACDKAAGITSLQQQQQQQQRGVSETEAHQSSIRQGEPAGLAEVPFSAQPGTDMMPNVPPKALRQRLFDIAARADEAALALKQEGEGAGVPYVWQLVYAAALDLARSGAMQEIIGHVSSCIQPYMQVTVAIPLLLSGPCAQLACNLAHSPCVGDWYTCVSGGTGA